MYIINVLVEHYLAICDDVYEITLSKSLTIHWCISPNALLQATYICSSYLLQWCRNWTK